MSYQVGNSYKGGNSSGDAKTVITIQPTNPSTIYVPYYDPVAAYETAAALIFATGVAVGAWSTYGYWNSWTC